MSLVAALPKPVVTAIAGPVLGGGLELALPADFRVAGSGPGLTSPRSCSASSRGRAACSGCPRLVGPARAKDIVFSGRMLTAAEAQQIGLVDQVMPDAEVYRAALDIVKRYANSPALALRAAKQAVDSGIGVDLATGLEIERVQFAALFGTDDQRADMLQLPGTGVSRFWDGGAPLCRTYFWIGRLRGFRG